MLLFAALLLAPLALYALHRLCLWLEARGQLYYWHKRPGGGVSNCLTPLQEALAPSCHVHVVHEEKRSTAEDEAPGGPR